MFTTCLLCSIITSRPINHMSFKVLSPEHFKTGLSTSQLRKTIEKISKKP